ncbi:hypothetical protein P4J63_31845, partial [Bacillus cereus]|nr:hypothetical protein [Bacillus cereus]
EQKERLRTIKDLDKAARQLREACVILLEHTDSSVHPKTAVFEKISEKNLIQAVQIVDSLTYLLLLNKVTVFIKKTRCFE